MNIATQCKVTILGQEYTLITDESLEHVTQAASAVDAALQEIFAKGIADQHKGSVLAALRFASSLQRIQRELDQIKEQSVHLTTQIDNVL